MKREISEKLHEKVRESISGGIINPILDPISDKVADQKTENLITKSIDDKIAEKVTEQFINDLQNLLQKNSIEKSVPQKRDFVGYGKNNFNPELQSCWPNNARLAISFVINYEEGAESCILDGDQESEHQLNEIFDAVPLKDQRNLNVESMYEFGSRVGFWRLHRLFTQFNLPVTVYACGLALEKNPEVCKALNETENWEVASHGYRWLNYQYIDKDIEREHIRKAIQVHKNLLKERPYGFYQGKPSPNTRQLVIEGGFIYDNDCYSDELPFWNFDYGKPHLVIPYTLDNNDMRFYSPDGFVTANDFYQYLKDSFDCLYEESKDVPKMMSIGLHCRIIARPGRIFGLKNFLKYILDFPDIWICQRKEIAQIWHNNFYPR